MNGQERLITALKKQKPDRIPTFEWVISKEVIRSIKGYEEEARKIVADSFEVKRYTPK